MACPYFCPTKRLDSSAWAIPPRLPLGDPYAGECHASAPAFQPDEERLRKACNPGYGRGRCDRFPADADSDAVRFHVTEDRGDVIHILYVLEKACWPFRQGRLEYCSRSRTFPDASCSEILKSQAAAFLESYLRWRA